MATTVLMPQLGESIAEGTIVRWVKAVGDHVDRDEPLFEISTDKVDAEIPSPAAGVVLEIRVPEGETVPVDSVVALIGQQGESLAGGPGGCTGGRGAVRCCLARRHGAARVQSASAVARRAADRPRAWRRRLADQWIWSRRSCHEGRRASVRREPI